VVASKARVVSSQLLAFWCLVALHAEEMEFELTPFG
jgi:hypothetical protein